MIKNVYQSSCKVQVILARFYRNLNFSNIFSKNPRISNFVKIGPVGAELFYTDRGRDGLIHRHDEDNSRFFFFGNLRTCLKMVRTNDLFVTDGSIKTAVIRNILCLY